MNIEGMDCGELSVSLDYEYGIVNRSGLHCAPLAHQTIGTFESGTCRFSPGFFTTEADIDTVIRAVHELASGSDHGSIIKTRMHTHFLFESLYNKLFFIFM